MLSTKRRNHHRLYCVHTVLGLVEDYAGGAFEHVLSDFNAVEAELLEHILSNLGLTVVVGREAVHELALRVTRSGHKFGINLEGP